MSQGPGLAWSTFPGLPPNLWGSLLARVRPASSRVVTGRGSEMPVGTAVDACFKEPVEKRAEWASFRTKILVAKGKGRPTESLVTSVCLDPESSKARQVYRPDANSHHGV